MKSRMAVTLLVTFAATSAFADHARSRSGGGSPSGGGHASRGFSAGSRSGGHAWGGSSGGGYAYRRGPGGGGGSRPGPGPSGAQLRHPRAGTGSYYYGHGYGHGYGYGHGHGYYGYGHGHGYYGYPYYYGGYGYDPYAWAYGLGVGLSFYYGGGSPAYSYGGDAYSYGGEPGEEPYAGGGGGAPDQGYPDRDEPREMRREETAELRLQVQPDDASVYVDDEFRGTARQLSRLRLAPGRHRVEVIRPGFRVAERRVEVGPGATVSVQIDLERP